MAESDAELVGRAFAAYRAGDGAALAPLVSPELEWTFLDPSVADPEPQVCTGRDELVRRVEAQHRAGLRVELEEVVARAGHVLVVTHVPGLGAQRARGGDHNYHLVTVRDGSIVALRACRDRAEAELLALA